MPAVRSPNFFVEFSYTNQTCANRPHGIWYRCSWNHVTTMKYICINNLPLSEFIQKTTWKVFIEQFSSPGVMSYNFFTLDDNYYKRKGQKTLGPTQRRKYSWARKDTMLAITRNQDHESIISGNTCLLSTHQERPKKPRRPFLRQGELLSLKTRKNIINCLFVSSNNRLPLTNNLKGSIKKIWFDFRANKTRDFSCDI